MKIQAAILEKDLNKIAKLLVGLCLFMKTESTKSYTYSLISSLTKELSKFGLSDYVQQALSNEEPDSKTLRTLLLSLKKDTSVSHEYLGYISTAIRYLVSSSDIAFSKLLKDSGVLEDIKITKEFLDTEDTVEQKQFIKPLDKIVRAVTKQAGVILSREDSAKLKEKFPKVHAEYLRLRKGFNESWKSVLRNYIFSTKKSLVDYDKALDFLKSQGVLSTLPKAFVGKIDSSGRFYTKEGRLLANVPGVGFSVLMNPDYNGQKDDSYVFTTINEQTGERSQHVYTVDYKKVSTDEKFDKVRDLAAEIEPIRKKWLSSVKKSDLSPQCVASTVLELLYQFSARIGSINNQAGGTNTYGMSTLLAKHFKKQGNKYLIVYQGKDGVRQRHILEGSTPISKILVKNIDILLSGKGPNSRVFEYEIQGKVKPMTGNLVNKWFQKLGSKVTVHKLRHVKGTQLFAQLLEKNKQVIYNKKSPLTESQANSLFKKLATTVGQMLGHVKGVGKQEKPTAGTAIANYIDPGIMVNYFTSLGFRPPKFLSKFN